MEAKISKKAGYCSYCKDSIPQETPHIVYDGDKYHIDCYKQMNLYTDNFGDNLDYFQEQDEF